MIEEQLTILMIDNLLSNECELRTLFAEKNYNFVIAKSGEQALQAIQGLKPDVILLDVILSDRDDVDIEKYLMNDRVLREIPVIKMVTPALKPQMIYDFEVGVRDYLFKPLQTDELMIRISTLLASRQLKLQNLELEQGLTELVEQNKQLKLREQFSLSILDNLPEGIMRFDSNGRLIYVNQILLDRFAKQGSGLSVQGKTLYELPMGGSTEQVQALLDAILRVVATGKRECVEHTSSTDVTNILCVPEFDEKHNVSSVLALTQNITELSDAKTRLKLKRATLNAFFNTISDMMWIKDINGRFTACNSAFERVLGVSADEILGKTDADFFDKAEADIFVQRDKETIVSRALTVNEEWITIASDGRKILLETSKSPLIDVDGNVIGILGIGQDTTDIKNKERQLQTLLDNYPDVIVRYDRQFRRLYVSPEYERVNGLSADDVLGKSPAELSGNLASIAVEYMVQLRAAFEHSTPIDAEFTWLDGNGVERVYNFRFVPEHDEEGTVTTVLSIGRDISNIRNAISLVKTKEQEYRTLIESLPNSIVRYDRDCRRTFVNQNFVQQTGISIESALYCDLEDSSWGTGISFKEYCRRLLKVMKTGEADTVLVEFECHGGESVFHEISLVAEYDIDGQVIGALAMGLDVSVRKRMEEEILYRANQFRTLAENSPNVIIRYDSSFRCIYVNPSYLKANGITSIETYGEVATQWQSALDEYNVTLKMVIATGEPEEFILEYPDEDSAQDISYAINVVAERDRSGNVLGALVIAHDITAIKNIENRLAQSYEQLRGLTARLVNAREENGKSIARELHDELGQYLTALRMGLGILKMQSQENNPVILKQATDLLGLVDHIIVVVRNVATSMRPEALDMGIMSALEWLKDDFIKRTGVSCNLNVSQKEIVLDEAHATALFRIVQESLTNIIRHADASEVEISFKRQDENLLLEIEDNGNGFDTSVCNPKSFGLIGLRERVGMLNGEVDISSINNCGTCVTVKIPMV